MPTPAKKPDPRQTAYEGWKDEQVRLGLEDIEAGNVISQEQYKRDMADHMKKLAKKHGCKAA